LSQSKTEAIKTQCRTNLRQIGIGCFSYANDNRDVFVGTPAGGLGFNQRAILPPEAVEIQQMGLIMSQTNGTSLIWCCPSIPSYGVGLPTYQPQQGQWLIGYNYMGGVTIWVNTAFPNGTPSYSPVKLSTSKPRWILACDSMNRYVEGGPPGGWDIGEPGGVPHRRPHTDFPDGANELTTDGAVRWYPIEQSIQISEFDSTYENDYFYQGDLPPTFNQFVLAKLALPPLGSR
jgi:hypothetical protein